jgi:hypothetical protein
MPIPVFLILGAAAAAGAGAGVANGARVRKANDTIREAQRRHENNIARAETDIKQATLILDNLEKKELEVLKSFKDFSDLIEKIQNRPEFKEYRSESVKLPDFSPEEIRRASIWPSVLMTSMLGTLVGGIVLGVSLSNKADEAWNQMLEAEKNINRTRVYLAELKSTATEYRKSIDAVFEIYLRHLNGLDAIITINHKTDWNEFSVHEKRLTENLALLVKLLYMMCKVKLVRASKNKDGLNIVNKSGIKEAIVTAQNLIKEQNIAN